MYFSRHNENVLFSGDYPGPYTLYGKVRNQEYGQGTDLTLCFQYRELPFIWREDICQGISAGCSGGGTVRTDLPEDFFVGYDAERFADDYVGAHHWEKVRGNAELAAFLAEANRRVKEKNRK